MMRSGKRIREFDTDSSKRCKRGDLVDNFYDRRILRLPVPFNASTQYSSRRLPNGVSDSPDRVSKCLNCFREQSSGNITARATWASEAFRSSIGRNGDQVVEGVESFIQKLPAGEQRYPIEELNVTDHLFV